MKHTIIMSGGLGNQMFQYAFYLSMKAKGKKCKIDDTLFYITKMHNGFELKQVFQLQNSLNKPSSLKKIWMQLLRRFKPSLLLCTDSVYQYCPEVYESRCPYFMGDWLSPEYFANIESTIVNTYRFHNIISRNVEIVNQMQASNSVSIHIRRGDYLNLPNYCVCDEGYYRKAINLITESVSNPVFYVFSNEPEWCENFMRKFGVKFVIVDWNQGKYSYQDMYLMTQCKNNIIANSTFSWWGAWLNQYVDKIVIAPRMWFKNNNCNINCPEWRLIDTK